MSLGNLVVSAEQILGLIKIGVVIKDTIVGAVRAGKVDVQKDGAVMTADELAADIDATQHAALDAGDHAAGRIEDRHKQD